jgi:hypothetical protein
MLQNKNFRVEKAVLAFNLVVIYLIFFVVLAIGQEVPPAPSWPLPGPVVQGPVANPNSCVPNEPHMQFFSNPPMGEIEVIIWRRIDPRNQVIVVRTYWYEECFAVTRSLVNLLSPYIKWEHNICVYIRAVDQSQRTAPAQCNGNDKGVTNK